MKGKALLEKRIAVMSWIRQSPLHIWYSSTAFVIVRQEQIDTNRGQRKYTERRD